MLKPLDRCRGDSTLFQFTTRNLRDFIDPDYLLIRVDVQFDLGQAGPCVLAGGGVHLALESGVGLHGAHGHGPVEADALPAQGAVQRRASEAHVVGRDQPVLLQQRLQSSMTRWTPGLPRTSASVIPWTRVASRDIGTPGSTEVSMITPPSRSTQAISRRPLPQTAQAGLPPYQRAHPEGPDGHACVGGV